MSDEEELLKRKGREKSENILGKKFEGVREFYTIGKVIGEGRYGLTREATCLSTNKMFACKTIMKNSLKLPSQVAAVKRETEVLGHLKGHGHVVALERVIEDKNSIHIIMEHCNGENILKTVSTAKHYSERVAAQAIRIILNIVADLHSKNVIHRDIRPESFLLTENDKEGIKIKAIHFGSSSFFSVNESFQEYFGDALYVAPEVIKGNYCSKADIWSCGVLLFTLLSGLAPFPGENQQEIYCRVVRSNPDYSASIWESISPEAKNCVKKMLQRDPRKRPTAEEILKDPWLAEGTASTRPLNCAIMERLKTFLPMNALKKETLKVISRRVPTSELNAVREMFFELDLSGTGFITIGELKTGLRRLGTVLPDSQLQLIMEAADVDQDGRVDYDEFIHATVRISRSDEEKNIKKAFKHFDKDRDGYITQSELVAALKKRNDAGEIAEIIAGTDKNQDGLIDFEEYTAMMKAYDDIYIQ